jgi:hypothetical protein
MSHWQTKANSKHNFPHSELEFCHKIHIIYEGNLQSSWTHLITLSRNSVEVWWRSLFRSTSLGEWCTSYNAPPTSQKRTADLDHFEISCLGAPFSWLEKPRNRMGRDLNWIVCSVWKKWIGGTPLEHSTYSLDLANAISGLFQPWKWRSKARNFGVINYLQHVFKKWVECCKKCITCQGRYFERDAVTAPPQSSDLE